MPDELDFVPPRKMDEAEIVEARRIMAIQASTRPADGNIGPEGAWARAEHVQTVGGRRAHDTIDGPIGFPSLSRGR